MYPQQFGFLLLLLVLLSLLDAAVSHLTQVQLKVLADQEEVC